MAEDCGEKKRMKILVVEPGKVPCVRGIAHGLKAMQQVVGGPIQAVYAYSFIMFLIQKLTASVNSSLKSFKSSIVITAFASKETTI